MHADCFGGKNIDPTVMRGMIKSSYGRQYDQQLYTVYFNRTHDTPLYRSLFAMNTLR